MSTLLPLGPDELLSTTRAVRKRLDFSRPVAPELIRECIEVATQAPTGGNNQGWHFIVITDTARKRAIGELVSMYAFLDGTIANAGRPSLTSHDPSAGS